MQVGPGFDPNTAILTNGRIWLDILAPVPQFGGKLPLCFQSFKAKGLQAGVLDNPAAPPPLWELPSTLCPR